MGIFGEKLKEVVTSVLPITILVMILNFTLVPLEQTIIIRFIIGAISLIIGLSIFLIGIDLGITPIGVYMGGAIAKSNKLKVLIVSGLILGFSISVAEPDLHILAAQVAEVTAGQIGKYSLVVVVSLGVSILLTLGLMRIVKSFKIRKMFIISYLLILSVAIFASFEFHAIAFDSSGATTGAMTVPFMLALAMGVSTLNKNSLSNEDDSFGLVGLASAGAILAVLIYGVLKNVTGLSGTLTQKEASMGVWESYLYNLSHTLQEALIALLPIAILFAIFQIFILKEKKKHIMPIVKGLIYTYVGLVLFLTGVNAGFMDVGKIIGMTIANKNIQILTISIGFLFGLVTILAEPAVHVLTQQIEEVTGGSIKRKLVLIALCLGVGSSVALSVVRITVPSLQLWHFLLPGYLIALIISFFVSDLFIGIAFDSGGVASGPMTATFILSFALGVAETVPTANVLIDGFGIIAMVAMSPVISLQLLGIIYKIKLKKGVGKDV